jgi:ComF family protein
LPLPYSADIAICGECLATPPSFTRAFIPFRYQFPVDSMISRYKYNHQRKFARPLITRLSQYLMQADAATLPEVLIPAPMHPQRRRKRGFNHAQDIAEQISQKLDIPVARDMVRRAHNVHAQRGLSREQRLINLRDVFDICKKVPERVAIVDDVVTTGATVRMLSSALNNAGARDIQIWALARTPG